MIALASVDLPEPFGPIRAWISPFSTSRSRPLRICLPSAVTCRLRISRSAICLRCRGLSRGRASGLALPAALLAVVAARRTRPGRRAWCPASALVTPPCTRVQSSFVAQAWSPSVSCEHRTLPSGVTWKHSIGAIWPSSACDHLEHLDLCGRAREPVAAVRAAGRGRPARPCEASRPDARGRRGAAARLRPPRSSATGSSPGWRPELDHQADSVLGFGREQHRHKSY